jgi:class 3 adenylate cyclase
MRLRCAYAFAQGALSPRLREPRPQSPYACLMALCTKCDQDNPEGARFCLASGTALDSDAGRARKERKVVSVLFCDLVGSTARAEQMDPEDVSALLSAYHARVKQELERFGGTVEKFVGDAVMALFGAPTAHEDDPERAVNPILVYVARSMVLKLGTGDREVMRQGSAHSSASAGFTLSSASASMAARIFAA